MKNRHLTFWQMSWKRFCKSPLSLFALLILALFVIAGIYAPLLASSKPLFVEYEKEWYFPLWRYLFFLGFYTKPLDIFYNLLMFTIPFLLLLLFISRKKKISFFYACFFFLFTQLTVFSLLMIYNLKDPAFSLPKPYKPDTTWKEEVEAMNPYARLNLLLRYQRYKLQKEEFEPFEKKYKQGKEDLFFPSLWNLSFAKELEKETNPFLVDKHKWLNENESNLHYVVMPFFRSFHWEEDAGGSQEMNHHIPWYDLTRINRKDLTASLIFGIRISLSVGFLAIGLALLIGVPIGALSGYYGGKIDLCTYRLIEIWESMPTFFMLLLLVGFLQTKSIFLVIAVIGVFGWTRFSRFIRGEFFRQKELLYVEACHALGYSHSRIIFSHLLPNALPPLLTLVPFAIMGAIGSEAGLSFLGLGEEGSASWGVLMDEGRSAFPSESYLLWPPATLLMLLLISIALVGDGIRDALDPKAA